MYEGNAYAKRSYTVLADWPQKENSEISTERGTFAWVGSVLQFHKKRKIPIKSDGCNTSVGYNMGL